MAMAPEEKDRRYRQRLLGKAAEYSPSTYLRRFVSPDFQRCIRAEFGAKPDGMELAVVKGEITRVPRYVGECVCVTCGKTAAWDSGITGIHTGHFIASRRNSIVLEEMNVAPQCSRCNYFESGAASRFHLWMEAVRPDEIDRLTRLKTESVSFTCPELVDLRIGYLQRIKAAVDTMKTGDNVPFS